VSKNELSLVIQINIETVKNVFLDAITMSIGTVRNVFLVVKTTNTGMATNAALSLSVKDFRTTQVVVRLKKTERIILKTHTITTGFLILIVKEWGRI
jgi:hypothetical protein